jgi:hypothetical protein
LAGTIRVPAGGDLQAAINAAQPGDEILLAAGAVYTGNFRLPATAAAVYITIRTESPQLPAAGVRVSSADASQLAKLKSPNASPALSTLDAAHHWRIQNVEFPATASGAGDIIALGSGTQSDAAQLPHDVALDRVYVHGDPAAGQKRGIALNAGDTEVINSYVADIKATAADSLATAPAPGGVPSGTAPAPSGVAACRNPLSCPAVDPYLRPRP